MADRKPIVEIGGELTNLDTSVDELDVPLEKLNDVDSYAGNADTFLAVRDDVTKADWRVTAPASGTSWQYSSSTSMADPGSGFFRLNDVIGSATAMAISTTGRDLGALGVILLSLKVGDLVRIQRTADGASNATYKVTEEVVDNTTWVQITIAVQSSAGTFGNNQSSAVQFFFQAPAGGSSNVSGVWRYNTTTTMADPGSGRYRRNNATPASVTALAIHSDTDEGTDTSAFLSLLATGNHIYIQEVEDSDRSNLYTVSGPSVDNGTWYQVPVTHDETGPSAIRSNKKCAVFFVFSSAGGSGGGGSPAHVDLNKTTSEIVSTAPIKVLFDDVTITGDVSFFSYAASSGNVVVNKDCIVMMQFEYSFVVDFGSNAPIARAALAIDFVNTGDNDQGIFSTTSKAGISSVSRIRTITAGETLSAYFYSLDESMETGANQVSMQIWVLEDLS